MAHCVSPRTTATSFVKKPFQPFFKPKFKDTKTIEHIHEEEAPKIEAATFGILPKKRGRPRKEEQPEEFASQKRRRFAIKKVTQIKTKKEK